MDIKVGDYVVITHRVNDTQWGWIREMDKLVGEVGIVTERVEGWPKQGRYARVLTPSGGHDDFVFHITALRLASLEEVRVAKFLFGVRGTK